MAEGRDWARTQFEACPDCLADPSQTPDEELGTAIVREIAAWGRVLAAADPVAVRIRPGPDTWSALEYACHVRDLLPVMDTRVRTLLTSEDPVFEWWDHEAAVTEQRYAEQVPVLVQEAAAGHARSFAATLGGVTGDQWERHAARRPGEVFTLRGLARFVLHEVIHHRDDAERVLRSVPPAPGALP